MKTLKTIASYWQVFRLVFVVFSLYLMGDAFFRWDGFSYYATFSEFLPAVALATILWSIVALIAALPVWLAGRSIEWVSRFTGWKIKVEHLLLLVSVFAFLGAMVWHGRQVIWNYLPKTIQVKIGIVLAVILIAVFLVWLFKDRVDSIQESITPLVWLFGLWVIISVPLVAYHTWGKEADNVALQRVTPPAAAGERQNIILVTFDTLTARNMSVYGYDRPTTPFISEWARSASLFSMLQADSNFTTPAVAAIMTGKRSWTHGTYHLHGSMPYKSDVESLPLLLKRNGYYNMAFVANPYASVKILGLSRDFDLAPLTSEFSKPATMFGWEFGKVDVLLYRIFGDKIRLHDWIIDRDFILGRLLTAMSPDFSETEGPPEKAFNRFLEAVDTDPSAPFFAWIHLFPPHSPYLAPAPFMGMFDPSPGLRTFKDQPIPPLYDTKPEDQQTVDTLRARYDEQIRYCDEKFKDFISALTKRDMMKNTVIVFSADHGEIFGHNFVGHGGPYLYEQVTHIPLIIKEPGQTGGRIISDLVGQIDLAPTILDLAGIPVPQWMEGRSLVPLMRGEKLPSRPQFSMNFEKNPSRWQQITRGSIAVWEGDYKLIYDLEEDKALLFNLRHDPEELDNLFDKEPEAGQRLLSLIKDNLKKANERISRGGETGEEL